MTFISEDLRGPMGQNGATVFVSVSLCELLDLNPIKVAVISAHPGSNCWCNCSDPTGPLVSEACSSPGLLGAQ